MATTVLALNKKANVKKNPLASTRRIKYFQLREREAEWKRVSQSSEGPVFNVNQSSLYVPSKSPDGSCTFSAKTIL